MDSFRLDLRYAVRALWHRPGFSLVAVLTLAIGMGVNAVAFSAFNALLLKPFSFDGVESLGWVMTRSKGNPNGPTSLPDYRDLAAAARSFEALVAEGRMPLSLLRDRHAEQAWGLLVSTNYLSALRARPRIGRLFTEADLAGVELPAVVSERFWRDRLGGGDSIAGATLTLNRRSFAVVGVLPKGFQGPGGLYEPEIWLPLDRMDVLDLPPDLQTREGAWLRVAGRLKPGASAAAANAELSAMAQQLAAAYPATNRDRALSYVPMVEGHPDLRGIATIARIALAVVGLVLLIACFNVAGLLLARASERQREIGVRAALGATRGRILRQLVTEGLILAVLSGSAALVLAAWSADLLSAFSLPSPIPQRLHMRIDTRLVLFTAALVALGGVLPALIPALHASRADLVTSLRMEWLAARGSRTRNLFVVAQVAGSTLFLAAALLFVRSFWNAATFDPGFDTTRTLVLEITPSTHGYDAARARSFFDELLARLAAVPGVRSAAIADRVPFYVGYSRKGEAATAGEDCAVSACRTVTEYAVGTGHFAALGVSLVAGRDFTDEDVRSGEAVVVSRTMAAQFWPGQSAIGQSFRYGPKGRQVRVIGVAADIKHRNMAEQPAPYLYRPLENEEFASRMSVIVRAADDPRQLIGTVQEQVHAIDSNLPAAAVDTMERRMEMPLWPARTAAGFFAICGTLALALATVGLFGVTYFTVNRRMREFGVRLAIGATPRRLMLLVARDGLALTLPGVILGIAAALVAARAAGSLLFGVTAGDPVTYTLTAALQALVALAACALPAYRASRADPMIALRQE